jgi:hypothetical protein
MAAGKTYFIARFTRRIDSPSRTGIIGSTSTQLCLPRNRGFVFASTGRVRKILHTRVGGLRCGLGDLDKILELDHQLSSIPGLRYKVDRNHNLVYLELDQPTITFREIRAIFRKLSLDPRFIGAIPGRAATEDKNAAAGRVAI